MGVHMGTDSRLTHDEFNTDFLRFDGRKKTLAKVVGLVTLGALVGPGEPDPDFGHYQIEV